MTHSLMKPLPALTVFSALMFSQVVSASEDVLQKEDANGGLENSNIFNPSFQQSAVQSPTYLWFDLIAGSGYDPQLRFINGGGSRWSLFMDDSENNAFKLKFGNFGDFLTVGTSGDLTVDQDSLFVDATNDRVGIGTISPTSPLHVKGDLRLQPDSGTRVQIRDGNNVARLDLVSGGKTRLRDGDGDIGVTLVKNGNYVGIYKDSASHTLDVGGTGRFTDDLTVEGALNLSDGSYDVWEIGYARSGTLRFLAGASGITFKQNIVGHTLIGMNLLNREPSSSFMLEVVGSAAKPGGGSWSSSSDGRLKRNVQSIDGALGKLLQLHGMTFEWINPELHRIGPVAGVVAQDVEKVFPDWIEDVDPHGADKALVGDGEKSKAVYFPHDFNAYLIEALRELDTQNKILAKQVDSLTQLACIEHAALPICTQ